MNMERTKGQAIHEQVHLWATAAETRDLERVVHRWTKAGEGKKYKSAPRNK